MLNNDVNKEGNGKEVSGKGTLVVGQRREITQKELTLDERKEELKKAKGGTDGEGSNGGRERRRGLASIAIGETMQGGCRLLAHRRGKEC